MLPRHHDPEMRERGAVMSYELCQPEPGRSFLNAPVIERLDGVDADFVVIGAPYGIPYGMAGVHNQTSEAPGAIRMQSMRFGYGRFLEHWDFDLDGPLYADKDVRLVDAGDVVGDPLDIRSVVAGVTEVVKQVRASEATPIILGGDDSIPIPALRAYEGEGPITLLQVDAHIDWRDDVAGVREGYSSPMRRASEMPWIGAMVQVGMRGVGSAREAELRDAVEYGSRIVTAREVHRRGAEEAVLSHLPEGQPCFITIDCDGLDPSIMPAVGAPAPGGLLYDQVIDILHGVAARVPVVGLSLVELTPARDLNGLSALTATRLILNLIGSAVRSDYFRRSA
jgi:agmatinase